MFTNGLNPEQKLAIEIAGDVLLVACPGSGKTRTLIHKIAAELSEVQSTREFVVALTYTHVAAEEIRDRVDGLGIDTKQLWVGTIHSFCLNWILRPYSIYHPALKDGFTVIDTFDREALLDRIAKKHPPLKSHHDFKYYATETGYELDKYTPQTDRKALRLAITEYHDQLLQQRKIDFEMMLKFAHELISRHKPIAKRLSRLFRLIAIDEYQDTREIQYSIVASVVRGHDPTTRLFIVGDPNQAIFGSLGGVAKTSNELETLIDRPLVSLSLKRNYRSSSQIVSFFSHFAVEPMLIEAVGEHKYWEGAIVHDVQVHKDHLVKNISSLIRSNVKDQGITPSEICIVAPWWMHLAPITRSLIHELPEYEFNGPGLSPFGQNTDNFWYKVARIALTSASPDLYRKRVRWANDVLDELRSNGFSNDNLSGRDLLKVTNGIELNDIRGTVFLANFFRTLFAQINFGPSQGSQLAEQYNSFFQRMHNRLMTIQEKEDVDIDDVSTFRKVFSERHGINISTIHGVKGMEFDSVIAFGLLEDIVPHFGEPDSEKEVIAKRLMFVIGSRARKHLYLISEEGRGPDWSPKTQSNILIDMTEFPYTSRSIRQSF